MSGERTGQVAVIFTSVRTAQDDSGYGAAAEAMERLAAAQPGYRGFIAARGADGQGIAVSYWTDEAAAAAWRDHPEHARIRAEGRAKWYRSYELAVTTVMRGYSWTKA
ncbi:antibiotic biosynthesis monooxygenase [Sphingomonas gilva]|uniref:Antibiotic biosynthesis monooxygenase n=1 Tax=Sphingomonas gilva TaxID=2305907 RepID=A0A396RY65_9SPHN|nr:antibiotic biosynthesis monooxygenase [Sphingomonas gilva]RHW18671.1 antibiotic biosynthesis monooxygenase [Sphingomonas gilva]